MVSGCQPAWCFDFDKKENRRHSGGLSGPRERPELPPPPSQLVFRTLTSTLARQVALPTVFARAGPRSRRCFPNHCRAERSYLAYTPPLLNSVNDIVTCGGDAGGLGDIEGGVDLAVGAS